MSTNPQRSPEPHPPHDSASPPIPARSSVARSVLNATKRPLPANQRRHLASKARSKHPARPPYPVPSREWTHLSEAKSNVRARFAASTAREPPPVALEAVKREHRSLYKAATPEQ